MPRAAKHNLAVFLYDINSSPLFIEEANKWLISICSWKYFGESNDSMKLIFLGDEDSYVSHVTEFISYNPKPIKAHLDRIPDIKKANGNWMLGLTETIEELMDVRETKSVITLQIVLLTDFSIDTDVKENEIEQTIQNLNDFNIFLYILGPKVKIPEHMASFEDIQHWSKSLECLVVNPNLEIPKRIIQNCEKGIMCDLQIGMDLFKCYLNRSALQPWKAPLTIGTLLTFNTSTVRFLRSKTLPKLAAKPTSRSWSWCLAEDNYIQIPYDNVIAGIAMHGKFIPFSKDVDKYMKYSGPRSFKIIGFTHLHTIPEIYLIGEGAYYVKSDTDDKNFYLLLKVLSDQKKCAIVERIYMKNCCPKLMVLLPQVHEGNFLLIELPYKHNVPHKITDTPINKAPKLSVDSTAPIYKGMIEYLEKLDIANPKNKNNNGSVRFPLSPMLMDDLTVSAAMNQCLMKYFAEEITEASIPKVELPEFVQDVNPYISLSKKNVKKDS